MQQQAQKAGVIEGSEELSPNSSNSNNHSDEKYEAFKQSVKKAAEEFKQIDKSETIRVISHLDADGLSSAAIIVKALSADNRKYCLSTVHQLTEDVIRQLAEESYCCYIFTDLGTGQFGLLKTHLANKKVFVLDHHHLQQETNAQNVVHVNPHLVGIKESNSISGAGVAYFFAKALDERNKNLANVALIGAIGDMQESQGFSGLNTEILEDARSSGKLKVIKGLRFFGAQTKPLHKMLEQSTEYVIPGVSGNESAAVQFLQQIGINPKDGEKWRRLIDLSDEELQKLVTATVLQRVSEQEKSPEAIIGSVYILGEEAKGSPLRDAKEFATLLNACGRLNKASIGIGACLGDERCKTLALKCMEEYKQHITNALRWYEGAAQKNKGSIIKGKGYVIINAEDNVMPTIIGTLASMIAYSNELPKGTFILSMGRAQQGCTKASLRVAGSRESKNSNNSINLMELITEIAAKVGGEAGGHHEAAGAFIKTERETEFIEAAKLVLASKCIEESVL